MEALEADSAGALLRPEDVETFIASQAETQIQDWIRKNLWRGTLASIAYEGLRLPSVHNLGAAGEISFSAVTLDGNPVPDITFGILWETLQPMYEEARERSVTTNKWFGHDLREADGA